MWALRPARAGEAPHGGQAEGGEAERIVAGQDHWIWDDGGRRSGAAAARVAGEHGVVAQLGDGWPARGKASPPPSLAAPGLPEAASDSGEGGGARVGWRQRGARFSPSRRP